MLNSHTDLLSLNSATDRLIDYHTNSMWGDVKHLPSFPMIEFVGERLLDPTVRLDIHDIANFEVDEVGAHWDYAMLSEWAGEKVPSAGTVTKAVRHFLYSMASVESTENYPRSRVIPKKRNELR
jgi:hypothetical protein